MKLELHKNLKVLIVREGLTVSQLSRITKVPSQNLNNWINGQEPRSLTHLKTLADYFCVTVDFLLYETSVKKSYLRKNLKEPKEQFEDEINAGVFEVIIRRIKR